MKAPTCHPKQGIEGNRNVDQLVVLTIVADVRLPFKKIMDAYDTYYSFIRRLSTFLGIWPYQNSKDQFVRMIIVVSITVLMIAIEIFTFITMDHTLGKTCEILTTIIPTLTFSSAYYAPLYNSVEIKLTFGRMNYDWAHLKNLEELEIMKAYANQTRIYTLIFSTVMYISCVFIVLPPVIKIFLYHVGVISDFQDLSLPVDLEYYVDKHKYFYILFLHQFVSIWVLFSCAIAVYSMFFMMIQHACAAFRIISIPRNTTDEWILNCIERYPNVIDFIDTVNDSGEMCYLWQFSLSMILVSLSILHVFQMRTHSNTLSEYLYNSSCIPGPIVASYIACFIGQQLIDHSISVFEAVCQLSYYDTSLKMQKLLLFLIMRTAKPCSLSIGKLFIFSHEFFSATIQTSLSYAMVLYTFQ